jgi:Spy/CpxP family protein refolding chaperone
MNLRIWIPIATLGAALAQDPNLPPQGRAMPAQAPDFSALRAYLNLSDGQLEKMRQAREAAARQADEKVKALMPQIEDKRMALQDLVDRGADPAAVGKALLELRALEKQAHQAREAARSSQLSVLTPEQKTRFKAIEDAALLPAATRDAMRLGLVPMPPGAPEAMAPGGRVPR